MAANPAPIFTLSQRTASASYPTASGILTLIVGGTYQVDSINCIYYGMVAMIEQFKKVSDGSLVQVHVNDVATRVTY